METAYIKDSFTDHEPRWRGSINAEGSTECVVPDNMPDIGSIVDADGILCIRSKQIINGYLEVKADISAKVLYQPENEKALSSINVDIEILCRRELSADDNCIPYVILSLKTVDAKIINSRKLSVKAEIAGFGAVYEKKNMEIIRDVKLCGCSVEAREESCVSFPISDIREKTFVVTDDVSFPAAADGADRILSQRVNLTITETEYTDERLLFRGSAGIFLLLEQGGGIYPYQFELDFSQIMEIAGDSIASPDICLCLTGAYFDLPEHGGSRLGVELHLLAQAICRRKTEITCISDAYSNQHVISADYRECSLCRSYRSFHTKQMCSISVDAVSNIAEIIYAKCSVISVSLNGSTAEINLNIKCLYRDTAGNYSAVSRRAQQSLTADVLPEEEADIAELTADSVSASVAAGYIHFKIELTAAISAKKLQSVQYLCALSDAEGKLPEAPSLTLLYADEQSDLWSLAKQHRSTTQAILDANAGQIRGLILIPKCR